MRYIARVLSSVTVNLLSLVMLHGGSVCSACVWGWVYRHSRTFILTADALAQAGVQKSSSRVLHGSGAVGSCQLFIRLQWILRWWPQSPR